MTHEIMPFCLHFFPLDEILPRQRLWIYQRILNRFFLLLNTFLETYWNFFHCYFGVIKSNMFFFFIIAELIY